MADGDDDEEDDGDDGDDGSDGEQNEEAQDNDGDDSKIADEDMADVVDEAKLPTPSKPVVDAVDGISPTDATPPHPMTIAPPVGSLAAGSPRQEGSPLKNVVLPSPTEAHAPAGPSALSAGGLVPPPGSPPKTESMVAEPPSTVAGDERGGTDGDVPMQEAGAEDPRAQAPEHQSPPQDAAPIPREEDALLPPPPEQVGNISSPKSEDGPYRGSDGEDKSREGQVPERPPLHPQLSVMTEDTIKPEDSASVQFPLTESGAPSEVGTGSAEEAKDANHSDADAEVPRAVSPVKDAAAEAKPDHADDNVDEEQEAPVREPESAPLADRVSPVPPVDEPKPVEEPSAPGQDRHPAPPADLQATEPAAEEPPKFDEAKEARVDALPPTLQNLLEKPVEAGEWQADAEPEQEPTMVPAQPVPVEPRVEAPGPPQPNPMTEHAPPEHSTALPIDALVDPPAEPAQEHSTALPIDALVDPPPAPEPPAATLPNADGAPANDTNVEPPVNE